MERLSDIIKKREEDGKSTIERLIEVIKKAETDGIFEFEEWERDLQKQSPGSGKGTPFLCHKCRAYGFMYELKRVFHCKGYPLVVAKDWLELIDVDSDKPMVVCKDDGRVATLDHFADIINMQLNDVQEMIEIHE